MIFQKLKPDIDVERINAMFASIYDELTRYCLEKLLKIVRGVGFC